MGLAEVETEAEIAGQTCFEPAMLAGKLFEVAREIVAEQVFGKMFVVAAPEQSEHQGMSWTILVLRIDLYCH